MKEKSYNHFATIRLVFNFCGPMARVYCKWQIDSITEHVFFKTIENFKKGLNNLNKMAYY